MESIRLSSDSIFLRSGNLYSAVEDGPLNCLRYLMYVDSLLSSFLFSSRSLSGEMLLLDD